MPRPRSPVSPWTNDVSFSIFLLGVSLQVSVNNRYLERYPCWAKDYPFLKVLQFFSRFMVYLFGQSPKEIQTKNLANCFKKVFFA